MAWTASTLPDRPNAAALAGANRIGLTQGDNVIKDTSLTTLAAFVLAQLVGTNARAASTANVSVATAPASLDGVTGVIADVWLLKNQTAPAENGLYDFNSAGSALTRNTAMNSWAETIGALVTVAEGTVNSDTVWLSKTDEGGTLGTDAVTFVKLFGSSLYQPFNAKLSKLVNLVWAADKGLMTTSASVLATFDLTPFALTYLDDANAGAVRTTLAVPNIAGDTFTGPVRTPAGSAAAPGLAIGAANDGIYQISAGVLGLSMSGVATASLGIGKWMWNGVTFEGVAGATNGFQLQGITAGTASFFNILWIAAASGPTSYFAKSRNASLNGHTIVQADDTLGSVRFYGDNGTTWDEAARIRCEVDGTPGASADMPGRLVFSTSPDGSATVAERLRIDNAGNLQMGGTNTVIASTRHIQLRSYTIGTLPSAATSAQLISCSDLGGGAGSLASDGTNWRRVARGGQEAIATNAAFTLTPLTSAEEQKHTGTLTADRALTLSTTNAYSGARFRLTRTGAGAFNITHALKNLATNTWAEFIYDGAAWYLAAYGAL